MTSELEKLVPSTTGYKPVKNRDASGHLPALIVRPTEISHIQHCVKWAIKHQAKLTVIGGGHSGHCIWPDVVAIDMSAFDKVHIVRDNLYEPRSNPSQSATDLLVVAGTGCTTGDIIRATLPEGVTVPLGTSPSVGAGMWLQGGLGHLARKYGLTCDAILGAVLVSLDSAQVLCVGNVPETHWPADGVRPERHPDVLWSLKGAGTSFGIVVSVVFKTYVAPMFLVRDWTVPVGDSLGAGRMMVEFDRIITKDLPRDCSADAYFYWDKNELHLGVSTVQTTEAEPPGRILAEPVSANTVLGPEHSWTVVDGVGLFEAMSSTPRRDTGGKTSSFKRCLFLGSVAQEKVCKVLIEAVRVLPTSLSYVHIRRGGGAISDVPAIRSAFGCRNWEFACIIAGVWPRDQDGTDTAKAAVKWVYEVALVLLPLCKGVYSADLGPDPRDGVLASKAFGLNRQLLSRLKEDLDPHKLLNYTCPLGKPPAGPKLIFLITGETCAGKDYCATVWAHLFVQRGIKAVASSISDVTKGQYAAFMGADFRRLLEDRAYKELHRPLLTEYFKEQVKKNPQLPQDNFMSMVDGAGDVEVLLITGMRDEAPVATFSPLAPDKRVLEVRIIAEEAMRLRRGCTHGEESFGEREISRLPPCRPDLVFVNDADGNVVLQNFFERYLHPFLHESLWKLGNMVRSVPDFPRPGVNFRHILGICGNSKGLTLCSTLMRTYFTGDWSQIDAVVCCEAGGFLLAPSLATYYQIPLIPIREEGKLPPPTLSQVCTASHVSSSMESRRGPNRIEMSQGVLSSDSTVLVVDDVLATGETLGAVLQLLRSAGVDSDNINVMVVAEFPAHYGREKLRSIGFGNVRIQSLLVYGGY